MIYCVYHKDDYDGKCSAALIKHFQFVDRFIPLSYGDSIDWIKELKEHDTVYMSDISLPPEKMIELNKKCLFIWNDHHVSSIQDSITYGYNGILGHRNINLSGCELTWKWFNVEGKTNKIVSLLGRYDVWDMSDKNKWFEEILPFQNGMVFMDYSVPDLEIIVFESCKDDFISEIIEVGNTIIKYQSTIDRKAMENSYVREYQGYKCLVCNSTRSNSKFFESKWDKNIHDVMVSFRYTNNKKWSFSFYSDKPTIDCSKFAKLVESSGGGHRGAAGCLSDNNPFL